MKNLPFYIFAFLFSGTWLVGGIWLTVGALTERDMIAESARWHDTSCVVTYSKIVDEPGTGHRHKSLSAKCAYTVAGETHEFDCGMGVGLNYVKAMGVGTMHRCQFDPSNPRRAVFEHGAFLNPKTGLVMGPALAIVGLAMVYGLTRTLSKR